MKKYLSLFLFILSLVLVGCSEEDTKIKKSETLKVLESKIYFDAKAGTGTIVVHSDLSVPLTVESSTGWCKFVESANGEGNTQIITISVLQNTSYTGRSALISISDGVTKQEIVASQAGNVFYADSSLERRFGNEKQTFRIDLVSSFSYNVEIVEDWMTVVNKTDKYFEVEIAENTTGLPRATVIAATTNAGRAVSYAIYQYDGDDLVGSFASQASITWQYIGFNDYVDLSGANIVKNEDGSYQINFKLPLESSKSYIYSMRAVYEKNALLIESGQFQYGQELNLSNGSKAYAYIVGGDQEALKLNNFRVGFAPAMFNDDEGNVYTGYLFKEEDKPTIESASYLTVAYFTSNESPNVDNYISELTMYFNGILFYNQAKN